MLTLERHVMARWGEKKDGVLSKHQQMLDAIVASSQDWIWAMNLDGRHTYSNRAVEKILGYTLEEFHGIGLNLLHPEDRRFVDAMWPDWVKECHGWKNVVLRWRTKQGHYRYLESFAAPILGTGGELLGFCGVDRDITERKRAQENLQISEEQLSNALRMAHAGHWEYDVGTDAFTFNDNFYRIFRTTAEEVGGYKMSSADYVRRFFHPEDAHMMHETEAMIVTDDPYYSRQLEHRFLYADGKLGYVVVRVFIVKDADGKTIKAYGVNQDITDRKRTEETIKKSEKKYRELFDFLPIIVYEMDFEGNITSVNPSAYKIFRGTQEDFNRGIKIWRFLSADGVETSTRNIQRLLQGEQIAGTEYDLMRLDGSVFPAIVFSNVIYRDGKPVGLRGAIVDITQQRKQEEKLRWANTFLDSIVENIPDMIFLKDAKERRFIRINRAGEDLLGYSRQEMQGKNDYDIFPKMQADFFAEKDREALRGKKVVIIPEEPLQSRNKGERVLHTKKVPILDAKGHPQYILGISEDITERKRTEDEKSKLQSQLLRAQRMEAIGTLAGGIAHDFNNILAGIIGYVELAMMEQTPDPENKQHVYFSRMLEAGKRAKDLVQQVLNFSRGSKPAMGKIALKPIAEEAIQLLRSTLPKNIEIRQRLKADPDKITGDPTQIHQAIMNLCTNAYHVMRDSGGVLSVALENTRIGSPREFMSLRVPPGNYIQLSVSDTGQGIAPELLGRIFDPYFTTKSTSEGTGLGLSVTMGIIKGHNGLIEVESHLGKGTRFDLYFPVTPAGLMEANTPAGLLPAGKQEKILVVDDEPFFLDVVREHLSTLGYQVTVNQSAVKSLELFKTDPDGFNLLITDQGMPEMTGVHLVTEIRKYNRDIPIILCTGYSETVSEQSAKYYGITRFLMKPVTYSDLAWAVHGALVGEET